MEITYNCCTHGSDIYWFWFVSWSNIYCFLWFMLSPVFAINGRCAKLKCKSNSAPAIQRSCHFDLPVHINTHPCTHAHTPTSTFGPHVFLYSYGEGKKKWVPPKWRLRGHGVWPGVTALKWRHKSIGYSSCTHTCMCTHLHVHTHVLYVHTCWSGWWWAVKKGWGLRDWRRNSWRRGGWVQGAQGYTGGCCGGLI